MKHLVEKYPHGPNVHPIVVLSFEYHFWSHIFISSAEGSSLGVDILSTPTKVAYFDVVGGIQ